MAQEQVSTPHDRLFIRIKDKLEEQPNHRRGKAWVPGLLQLVHDLATTEGWGVAVEVDSYRGWGELAPTYVGDAVFTTKALQITEADTKNNLIVCGGSQETNVPTVFTGQLLSHVGILRPGDEEITWHEATTSAEGIVSTEDELGRLHMAALSTPANEG